MNTKGSKTMIGYKATYNGKCRNILYETGKEYIHDGEIQICESGFHFCPELKDVFNYYPPKKGLKVFKVDALGDIIMEDDKAVTNKLKIIEEIVISEWAKYNEQGNLIYFHYLNKNKYWEYNENNQVISYRNDNGTASYTYDKNNNLSGYKFVGNI
jgi:hypothetical protein